MEKLPVELWALIFAPLAPNHLGRLARVSRVWNRRLSADDLWHPRTVKLFGEQDRLSVGTWKARFVKLYLQEIRRHRAPPDEWALLHYRFLIFACISTAFLIGVASVLIPFSIVSLISSPLPAIAVYLTLRFMGLARLRIYGHPISFFRIRPYIVVGAILIQAAFALRNGDFTVNAFRHSMLFSYLMNCVGVLVWGVTRPLSPAPESRLIIMLLTWFSFSHGSVTMLVQQLTAPVTLLLRSSQVAPTALVACLLAKVFNYVPDSWPVMGASVALNLSAYWTRWLAKILPSS